MPEFELENIIPHRHWKIMKAKLSPMALGYVEAACFTDEEQLKEWGKDQFTFDLEELDYVNILCENFKRDNLADLEQGDDDGQAGRDLWYTRNGHGVGFWDRETLWGEAQAERLTEKAKALGQSDIYVGDNGLVYFTR